ncbi:DNA polymerase subunit gamma-2, mitochondrial [Trichoplax sp. H2]|nr:DNA polymerase subunit gamma-2, mitochondrial [Trichoplax sp. H2]|eukprot:RDD39992.1 DNA polymerase subunit gamma-2, mitochondrial [Trichoplax sp. H2]
MAYEMKDILSHLSRRGLFLIGTNEDKLGPLGILLMRNLYQEWRKSISIIRGKACNVLEIQPTTLDKGLNDNIKSLSDSSNSLLHFWNLDRDGLTSRQNSIKMMNPALPFVLIRQINSVSGGESFKAFLRFYCSPKESQLWYHTWKKERATWWRKLSINRPGRFVLEEDSFDDSKTYDRARIVLSYNNYKETVEDISYCKDSNEIEKNICNSNNFHSITCSSYMTQGVLAYLIDSYHCRQLMHANGASKDGPKSLKLHPRLSPIKAAIIHPNTDRIHFVELAEYLAKKLNSAEIVTWIESAKCLEECYKNHDEMGTLFCIVIDDNTVKYGDVKLRHRDTGLLEQIHLMDVKLCIERDLQNSYEDNLPPDLQR